MCRVAPFLVLLATVATAEIHSLTVTPDGPMSLAAARDELRKINAPGAKRIVARGGKYFLTETLQLDQRDAGLTIEAYPGEKPVLYGGRRVVNWKRDGDKFWAAELPEVKAETWDFRMLSVNGKFRHRSRLPETGAFEHLTDFDVKWMGTFGGGWKRKPTPEELTAIKVKPEDLPAGFDPANAEITVYHMWDESLVRVASVDPAANVIRFRTPTSHPAGGFGVHKYVVWNLREGLKHPGQWYLDRSAGKLVYWPMPGEDMNKAEVIAPTIESIVRIAGVKDTPAKLITLDGLTFSVTNTPAKAGGFGAAGYDGAVSLDYAEDCRLIGLTVFSTGGQGIKARNTTRLRARDNVIHSTGASGMIVHGDDGEVTGNLVNRIGLTYPSALGINCHGNRLRVAHNEVHDVPYSAITFSGAGHTVESNLVYRAMLELHDGAAFYSGCSRNTLVRRNLVRDVPDTGGYGSSSYYLDELSENCTVEENVSINVARPTHHHIGRRNFIRNNVFLHNGPMRMTFPRSRGLVFERNVIQASGAITFVMPVDAIASMAGNLISSGAGSVQARIITDETLSDPQPLEPRDGSLYADPGLENPAPGVYRFRSDSPAIRLGIRPLDVRGAGRRPNQ